MSQRFIAKINAEFFIFMIFVIFQVINNGIMPIFSYIMFFGANVTLAQGILGPYTSSF